MTIIYLCSMCETQLQYYSMDENPRTVKDMKQPKIVTSYICPRCKTIKLKTISV